MPTIRIYNYNNYYNRRVKRESALSNYGTPIYIETGNNVNFFTNDGVNTKVIAGQYNNSYDGSGDYLIYSTGIDDIVSRWYIVEARKNRLNQYELTLHRDVLADYFNNILLADTFIEKAILPDYNPLIYNREDFSVNQIKTSETPLMDETKSAWIVGYLARNYGAGTEDDPAPTQMNIEANVIEDYSADDLEEFEYNFGDVDTDYKLNTATEFSFIVYLTNSVYDAYKYTLKNYTWTMQKISTHRPEGSNHLEIGGGTYYAHWNTILNGLRRDNPFNLFYNNENQYITDILTYSTPKYNNIVRSNNKIVALGSSPTQNYFKINSELSQNVNHNYTANAGTMVAELQTYLRNTFNSILVNNVVDKIDIVRNNSVASYTLTEIASQTYKTTLPTPTNRLHLKDAPYDMFCIPFGEIKVSNSLDQNFEDFTVNKSLSLSIAQGLAKGLGTYLYDLQLLPYCPMTGFNITDDGIDINTLNSKRFNLVQKEDNTVVDIILWSTSSSGSKNIPITVEIGNKKVENQCDLYRLVSPNFNGQFEFSAVKNGGVSNINVDYTYLPYNPYIHLNPTFSELYGKDFNDNRGLICQGDFSIAYLSDAWTQYQINNKNYQNIFDREIQNMEITHKVQRAGEIENGITGTLQGVISGAGAGLLSGNPIGAVVGGIAGGIASAGGAVADYAINESLRHEALDYKRDMFGFNLENIQALPNSIAKTTAYNENNKIFPILEYYTCTKYERMAFVKKIAYNSMTVGVIGTIAEYIDNSWSFEEGGVTIEDKGYIKGKLIRIEDINDDYHLINAIADELNKGAYFK